MALDQRQIRIILRWAHIILGSVILCYIYSPFHKYAWFQIAVKFIVVPVVVLSGVWIWKFGQLNKLFKIKSNG